jgi:peptidoglycan/LPS O-acetylase OafA/YrhL
MKKKKIKQSETKKSQRIVFFDVLRIFFVALIVYVHNQIIFIPWFNNIFFSNGYLPFNIYTQSLSGIAVYGLIFVSGAVLEYNYKRIEGFSEYVKFLFKRFIRLYPAFWMSLILGIILIPGILQKNVFDLIFEFTGFFVIFGQGPGNINTMGWFIAAIFSLYILFPYLSKIVRKYQLSSLLLFIIVSYLSRYLLFTYYSPTLNLLYRWFPLCNLFEFCLGIYIVQNKFYPKNEKDHPIIRQLADLSYYVFLFHVIINEVFFSMYSTGFSSQFTYLLGYIEVTGTVIIVSWLAMILDKKIQLLILTSEKIKNFMKF